MYEQIIQLSFKLAESLKLTFNKFKSVNRQSWASSRPQMKTNKVEVQVTQKCEGIELRFKSYEKCEWMKTLFAASNCALLSAWDIPLSPFMLQ